jgi:hypothetical protein
LDRVTVPKGSGQAMLAMSHLAAERGMRFALGGFANGSAASIFPAAKASVTFLAVMENEKARNIRASLVRRRRLMHEQRNQDDDWNRDAEK